MATAREVETNNRQSHATTSDASSTPAILRQRRRSQSSSSSSSSSHPSTNTIPNRNRTTSGPTLPPQVEQQYVYSQDQSTSKFVTSSSDFHLPQRTLQSFAYSPSLISPTSNIVVAAGDDLNNSNVSLPLLRRKAAAAAALAHATRKGSRRGSMLGKEVAKNAEEESNEEEEEDDDEDMIEEQEGHDLNKKHLSSALNEDDQDDDMQIDTGDVTVAGVELESGQLTTGSSSPPNITSQKRNGSTTAVRRAVQRRVNLLPRDRGVLRVAASLRDETRPAEGEIASEAKLQRRLGPESDSVAPTTPKLLAQRSQSPFGPSSGGGMDRDDFIFPDGAPAYNLSDDSDFDGDDDMVNTKNGSISTSTAIPQDHNNESIENYESGIAIPGACGETQQREKLWLNFREGGNPRLSPGAERTSTRSRHRSITPGGINMTCPLSGSLGSTIDQTMDFEPSFSHIGSSPSLWGKSAKRKVGDDRFDPYSYSALHKRRAVSPIAFVSAINVHVRGHSNTTISPSLNQTSPLHLQAASSSSSSSSNQPSSSALPTPTPLSIPSPTLSISRGPGGLSGSFPRNITSMNTSRATVTYSANPSPSNTRPSTPTNSIPSNQFGSGPSPSLLSSSASKAATGPSGGGGNGNGGSGPGYGSGALGLSLGGGSKRYKEEQEEMEEEEGMLGDVSAIKL